MRKRLLLHASFLVAGSILGSALANAQAIAPADARAIAKEATVYGFPMVDSYRIQYDYFVDRGGSQYKAPWNTLLPGKDKESNWLPAPPGPFFAVLRLYRPEPAALDGKWKNPPLKPESGKPK